MHLRPRRYVGRRSNSSITAADCLNISINRAAVVGDATSDMLPARRARASWVGVLSGGCGQDAPRVSVTLT